MPKQRINKIAEEIKKEIGDIILTQLKDPRLASGVVSVTGVELSADLSLAKIYISYYGKEKTDDILAVFNKGAGYFRSELGKRIRIRHIPQLIFNADNSMEYGAHINKILKEIEVKNDV